MSSDLPSFLQPRQAVPSFLRPKAVREPNLLVPRGQSDDVKEMIFKKFELAFPRLIDRLYGGETINSIIADFPIAVDRGAFMRWIKKDASRFAMFVEAKETRTEIWTGEMMDIAMGKEVNGEPIELDRAKFIVDTMKWLIKSENRKGYGDSKQIEMTGTISVVAALQAAESRVEQIASFTDDDESEPTPKQLTESVEADWEETDDDD